MKKIIIKYLILLFLSFTTFSSAFAYETIIENRPHDAVVVTGSELSSFLNSEIDNIIAYSYTTNWNQIAIQIDEREKHFINQPYNNDV